MNDTVHRFIGSLESDIEKINLSSFKIAVKTVMGRLFRAFLSVRRLHGFNIIMTYHRVAPVLPRRGRELFVTVASLENHIKELTHFFDIVPLDKILSPNGAGSNRCAITFDDGWLDNYEYAYPILRKHRVTATIFVPVACVGSHKDFWFEGLSELAEAAESTGRTNEFIQYFSGLAPSWDTKGKPGVRLKDLTASLKQFEANRVDQMVEEGFRRLGLVRGTKRSVLNWSEAEDMGKDGITFGSHGLNHYILTTLGHSERRDEVVASLDRLHDRNVPIMPFFSYPNGSYDDEIVRLVANAGYQGGVTTRLGHISGGTNPYLLNRIHIHEHIGRSSGLFWFRILQALTARRTYHPLTPGEGT